MNELIKNLEYDEIKVTVKQKIYNFLYAKGIIKSPNWIFGGDWFCIKIKFINSILYKSI